MRVLRFSLVLTPSQQPPHTWCNVVLFFFVFTMAAMLHRVEELLETTWIYILLLLSKNASNTLSSKSRCFQISPHKRPPVV